MNWPCGRRLGVKNTTLANRRAAMRRSDERRLGVEDVTFANCWLELYKEMNTTDMLVKKRDNLRLEIRRMRSYMKKDKQVVAGTFIHLCLRPAILMCRWLFGTYIKFRLSSFILRFWCWLGADDAAGESGIKEELFISKLIEERKNDLAKIKNTLHAARPKENRTLSGKYSILDTFLARFFSPHPISLVS